MPGSILLFAFTSAISVLMPTLSAPPSVSVVSVAIPELFLLLFISVVCLGPFFNLHLRLLCLCLCLICRLLRFCIFCSWLYLGRLLFCLRLLYINAYAWFIGSYVCICCIFGCVKVVRSSIIRSSVYVCYIFIPVPKTLALRFVFAICACTWVVYSSVGICYLCLCLGHWLLCLCLLSMSMLQLFAYIFLFFYYKSQPKYQLKAFTLSKELINVASYPLLWLFYLLYYPLHLLSLHCPNR